MLAWVLLLASVSSSPAADRDWEARIDAACPVVGDRSPVAAMLCGRQLQKLGPDATERAFASPRSVVRMGAVDAVRYRREPRFAPLLEEALLHDPDAAVRAEAITSITSEALLDRALEDSDGRVRASALHAIAMQRGADVRAVARRLARDPDLRVRTEAHFVLARFEGGPVALRAHPTRLESLAEEVLWPSLIAFWLVALGLHAAAIRSGGRAGRLLLLLQCALVVAPVLAAWVYDGLEPGGSGELGFSLGDPKPTGIPVHFVVAHAAVLPLLVMHALAWLSVDGRALALRRTARVAAILLLVPCLVALGVFAHPALGLLAWAWAAILPLVLLPILAAVLVVLACARDGVAMACVVTSSAAVGTLTAMGGFLPFGTWSILGVSMVVAGLVAAWHGWRSPPRPSPSARTS